MNVITVGIGISRGHEKESGSRAFAVKSLPWGSAKAMFEHPQLTGETNQV
jgi:hypothetical protein